MVVEMALALAAFACGRSDAPAPIAFDREPCAHCRMVISEPRFAAQLQRESGEVESFDDPGCLLAALAADAASAAPVRALWFHHVREDRWLDASRVAFEPGDRTPMGYGLGAVDAGTPGAMTLAEARAWILHRDVRREGAR